MFDDSNLWCDDCGNSNSGECNKHGVLYVVPDSPFVSRARQTLPSILEFKTSADSKQGLSVFSRVCIQKRTRFGPLQAPPCKQNPSFSLLAANLTCRQTLPFKLFTSNSSGGRSSSSSESSAKESALWLNTDLDRNEELSNWMVFVAVARCAKEQNLVAFQYRAGIYFVSIKDIAVGEELRVWYAKEYAACMGIAPLPNSDSTPSPPEGPQPTSPIAVDATLRGARRLRPRPIAAAPTSALPVAAVCPVCRLHLPPEPPGNSSSTPTAPASGTRRAVRLRKLPHSAASVGEARELCTCITGVTAPTSVRPSSLTTASARAPAASRSRTPVRRRTVGRAATLTQLTQSQHSAMSTPSEDDDPMGLPAPKTPENPTVAEALTTSVEEAATMPPPRYPTRTSGPTPDTGNLTGSRSPARVDIQLSTASIPTSSLPREVFVGDWSLPSTSRQGMRVTSLSQMSPRRPPKRTGSIPIVSESLGQSLPSIIMRSKKDVKNEENLQRAAAADAAPSSHTETTQPSSSREHLPPTPTPELQPPRTPPQQSAVAGPSGLGSTVGGSGRRGARGTGEAGTAGRHVCRVCSKAFGSPGKLSQHMYSHTGERPFECSQCSKAFSSKFKLVRHVLIHSDERRYRCTVCERTFHRKDHLKNHVKVHSPVKKTFRCEREGCHKEYSSFLSFRKHAAVHAAEEGSLECKMCGKSFASKEEIVYHLKVHAGSRTVKNPSDKKYRCDHCERRFFTRKDVRRHLVVHTGKRDFLCQFCPQRFGRKDHLVRHIKKSHHHHGSAAQVAAAGESSDPLAGNTPTGTAVPVTGASVASRPRSKRTRPATHREGSDTVRARARPTRPSRETHPLHPTQSEPSQSAGEEYVLPHAPPEDSKASVMVLAAAEAPDATEGPPALKLADVEAVLQQAPPPLPPVALKVEQVLPVERSTVTVHHHPRPEPQPPPPPPPAGPSAAAAAAEQLYNLVYGHPPPPPYPTASGGASATGTPFDPGSTGEATVPIKLEIPPSAASTESALEFSHLLGLIPVTGTGSTGASPSGIGSEEMSSAEESTSAAVAAVHEELQRLLSTAVGADEAAASVTGPTGGGEPHSLLVGDAGLTSHILHLMQELQPVNPPHPSSQTHPTHAHIQHAPPPSSAPLLAPLLEPAHEHPPDDPRRRRLGQLPLPRFNQAFHQQTAPPATSQQQSSQQQEPSPQPPPT